MLGESIKMVVSNLIRQENDKETSTINGFQYLEWFNLQAQDFQKGGG